MSTSGKAVFLSYASEDAAAAGRLCDALRAAGIEVWFDQSELRGGDAWDASIRKQIKSCALFIPVLSSNTRARVEGYFRLEWKLGIDRSHLIAQDQPFLLPVAIDAIAQDDDRVPDRFRDVQWTRAPHGNAPPAFIDRVRKLLMPAPGSGSAAESSQASGSAPAVSAPARRSRLRWVVGGIAVAGIAAVVGIRQFKSSESPLAPASASAPSVAVPTSASADTLIPEKSIAVLPFVDMSERKDQEYFSDGLSEELLDLLAQVPDLRVAARTSSFYFKGKSEDVAEIGRRLRVAHLLEGSIRKSGKTVRVTAQLIRADNGYHLWSKTYDRDEKDIFKVQDEIAATVVEALKAQLLPAQQLEGRHRTDNPQAHTEYLIGNRLRLIDTPASNQEALAAYTRAIALDPHYAAAYSGLADAEWRLSDMISASDVNIQRATEAADKAISLSPNSPEGYWARGQIRMYYNFDWSGADADFKKALQLDPNFVPALVRNAALLATLSRVPEAIAEIRKAIAIDPLSADAWGTLSLLLYDAGQFAEARTAAQHEMEFGGVQRASRNLTNISLLSGKIQEAYDAAPQTGDAYHDIVVAMAAHSFGREAESRQALERVIAGFADNLAYQIAEIHAWRGDKDQAFSWLERARAQHDGGITYVATDRYLEPLRSDPRYPAFLKKLGL